MTNKTNQTITEPSVEAAEIGTYGAAWIDWMQTHHKKLVREMKSKNTFLAVAMSVDKSAWEYRAILDRDYAKMNPRPTKYEDVVKWERTREFYTDSTVMRERVLVAVTQP